MRIARHSGYSPWALRIILVTGCITAAGLALWAGDPAEYTNADPGLARLLRGMAAIKGVAVVGGVSAAAWRFGWRVSGPIALAYTMGCWILVGTTMLIWQLSHIALAALTFHAALIGVLTAAWRDDLRSGARRREFSRSATLPFSQVKKMPQATPHADPRGGAGRS